MTQHYVLRKNHLMRNSVVNDVRCGSGEEAVVRFAGCNFNCVHCFSFASSWPHRWQHYDKKKKYSTEEVAAEINSIISGYHYTWLRITGGEPFLNLKRANELCSALKLIEGVSENFNDDVVIQTNGFILKDRNNCLEIATKLSDLSLDVLIEISLKGTCSEEFTLLTLLPNSGYYMQLKAVENLREAVRGKRNLSYRLVMGYGPNSVSKNLPTHVFVHPEGRFLLQMRQRWNPHFAEIHERYLKESPSGHLGFSMACLVTQRWGIQTLRNIEKNGMLLRTKQLNNSERKQYKFQWESIYPYFIEMNPERFYALEFP